MNRKLKRPVLMIPGPTELPDEVRKRCGGEIIPHYDEKTGFPDFHNALVDKMKPIFGIEDDAGMVFIPNGSGTLAVNMALASLCSDESISVLVVTNGPIGEYMKKNVAALGAPATIIECEWGVQIDPGRVREAMAEKRHDIIYMTHNESTAAVLNPITPIGTIAREYDALLVSDSVSAIGGVEMVMGENGADIVCGATQKCLELPPGLAPIGVGPRAWQFMESRTSRRVPYYLDLMWWRHAAVEARTSHPQLTTGATTMLYALDWMAEHILEEGIANREARFKSAGESLRRGMLELGFTSAVHPLSASPLVSDFIIPSSVPDSVLVRNYYLERHNTMVGMGFANIDPTNGSNRSFRVAHFGRAAENDRIKHMLTITRAFVDEHGG